MPVKFRLDPTKPPSPMSETERARINALAENQSYADSPELDDAFFATAIRIANTPVTPKQRITTFIDADVAHWLRKAGPGYQTRLNAILRRAMEADSESPQK